jgi:hypothetical protein
VARPADHRVLVSSSVNFICSSFAGRRHPHTLLEVASPIITPQGKEIEVNYNSTQRWSGIRISLIVAVEQHSLHILVRGIFI